MPPNGKFQPLVLQSAGNRCWGAVCDHEQSCEPPRDTPEKLRLPHGLTATPTLLTNRLGCTTVRLSSRRSPARRINWQTLPNGKFQRVASYTFPRAEAARQSGGNKCWTLCDTRSTSPTRRPALRSRTHVSKTGCFGRSCSGSYRCTLILSA